MVLLTAPIVFVDFLRRFVLVPGRRAWSEWAAARGGEFRRGVPGFYGHVVWPRADGVLRLAEGPGFLRWNSRIRLTQPLTGAGPRLSALAIKLVLNGLYVPPRMGGPRLSKEAAGLLPPLAQRWGRPGASVRCGPWGCEILLPGSLAEDERGDEILAEAAALLEDLIRRSGASGPEPKPSAGPAPQPGAQPTPSSSSAPGPEPSTGPTPSPSRAGDACAPDPDAVARPGASA